MQLTPDLSSRIITTALTYLNHPYDFINFDCVRFIIRVYKEVGITIPIFGGAGFPPAEFHLSEEEFAQKPIGHSVFFRRKANTTDRIWTHMVLILSPDELIHCSSRFGGKVVITPWKDLFELYSHVPKR